MWILDQHFEDVAEPFDAALSSLLAEFDGRADALNALRASFDMSIRCYGSSDSSQGGFWVSAEVIERLGALGIDFYCTIYAETPEDTSRA